MKKYILLFLFASFVSSSLLAQLDRSKRPEAGPAPEINLGKAEKFTLDNGLKVFVISNHKLPRISYSLILDRDPVMEGDKKGMLGMVGEMMTAGTANRSKDQLNEEIDFIGARLSASSTSIFASSLSRHKAKMMELMADVLFNPVFPQSELDKLKTQAKSGLAAAKSSPNSISSILTSKLVFGPNHPYGETETEETIDNITVDDIKAYYNIYFKPNIAYLAIVGDITLDEAKKLVNQSLGNWKKGNVPTAKYDVPKPPAQNVVALVDRSSAKQSVLDLTYPVEMFLNNPDYLATRVINFVLGGGASSRLFMNLREDKGYTYGAYSSLGSDRLVTSFSAGSSVGNNVTDSAIVEIIYEIRKMAEKGITEEELAAAKANLSGSFGRSLESPSTIASFALNIERYGLPQDYYASYLQRLNALTVNDVNRAASRYLKPNNLYITVVGNAAEIKDKLTQFGPVQMYDTAGEPEKELRKVDSGISAESIIENYLKAIGGKDNIAGIRNAKFNYSTEIQGMSLEIAFIHDTENERFANLTSMMGNVMQKMVYKDGKALVSGMGQEQEMPEEEAAKQKIMIYAIPEARFLLDEGYTLSLEGIREIEGDPCYKVLVTDPAGSSSTYYFSSTSGLKVMSESAEQGDVKYENYTEHSGLLIPSAMVINNPMMPVPLNLKLESAAFNVELSDADF